MTQKIVPYKSVYQTLESRIRSGELSGKLPSQAQLISEFKVSHNTIKKVLDQLKLAGLVTGHQGKGVYVSQPPNAKRAGTAGIYLSYLQHMGIPFYMRALATLKTELEQHNWDLDYLGNIDGFDPHRHQALIVLESLPGEFDVQKVISQHQTRIIQLNNQFDPLLPATFSNNIQCGYLAMQQLYRAGHRNIGIITRETYHADSIFAYRLQGAKKFAAEHKSIRFIQLELDLRPFPDSPGAAAETATDKLLKAMPDVTAVFAFTDVISLGVISALQKRNLKVPEDISLISVDDLDFAQLTNPPLTTFREDAEAIGRAAAQFILQTPAPGPENMQLDFAPQLIERNSIKYINS